MLIITAEQFRDGLMSIPGNVKLNIRARTVPDLKKKDNHYIDRVYKMIDANGTIGANYQNSTNTVLIKQGEEPDFVAGPHLWADYVNRCFVQHPDTGVWYIRFQEKSRNEVWYLDDRPVDPLIFSKWIKERKEIVKYRNFTVDNILSIMWNKQEYQILHS